MQLTRVKRTTEHHRIVTITASVTSARPHNKPGKNAELFLPETMTVTLDHWQGRDPTIVCVVLSGPHVLASGRLKPNITGPMEIHYTQENGRPQDPAWRFLPAWATNYLAELIAELGAEKW